MKIYSIKEIVQATNDIYKKANNITVKEKGNEYSFAPGSNPYMQDGGPFNYLIPANFFNLFANSEPSEIISLGLEDFVDVTALEASPSVILFAFLTFPFLKDSCNVA